MVAALTDERKPRMRSPSRDRSTSTVAALAVWGGLVVLGASLVYVVLVAPGEKRLDGVPLHAAVDPHVASTIALPAGVLVLALVAVRRLDAMRWRAVLVSWWAIGAAWATALAASRGFHRLGAPLEHAGEYLAALPRVASPGAFLGGFVDELATYPTHVQGHPPGFVLVAWAARAVGLGGSGWLAVLVIAVGSAAVPLVLVTARDVVGEGWARRAAPFVAIAPSAIWLATSADAFFTGVGAVAVTLLVVATGRSGGRRVALALAGGVAFGATVMLSYGLVLLAAVPVAVAFARRAYGVVVIGAAGTAGVLLASAAAGFSWLDGLFATHDRYSSGIASRRPYELFVVVNVSILAIALGPAIAVALVRLRDRACWLLGGAALVALALADLSGMSKSEVERIWLPFVPYVLLAAGVFGATTTGALRRLHSSTGWLALQAGTAVVVESVVRTAW